MATNSFTAYCPDCGASLPRESRFCPQCGRRLVTGETLEHPADTVISGPAITTGPEPAEFPPTVHRVQRQPLGVHPVALLGGLGGLALLVAIILLAAAALVDGLILLALATALLALFLVGVRREPHTPTARLVLRAVDRMRSLLALAAVTVRASAGAAVNLLRIRHRQRRLRGEFEDRLAPLGEAVYREEQQRAQALKRQAAELKRELDKAEREASSVIDGARREIEQERATVEPTQAVPRIR